MTASLVLTAPNGQPGELYQIQTTTGPQLLAQTAAGDINVRTSPVYIEDYMPAAGNDVRTAIAAAWAANTSPGISFFYPVGTFTFVGAVLNPPDHSHHWLQGCELRRDMAGVASGQQIFFLRAENGANHPRDIHFHGGKYSLLNCLTSRFGYAIGILAGENCTIDMDAEAFCTLDPAATVGGIRWGFALFGGDQTADAACGTNNCLRDIKLTTSQIQGCAGPNSVTNLTIENVRTNGANDYAVSCVSSPGGKVRNVSIRNIEVFDAAGSGCVFGGSDGAGTGVGADVVENLTIDGVWLCGQRSTPNLSFDMINPIIVDGGILTENVIVTNIGTKLSPNAGLQSKGILIASQADEVSWHGLQISNANLGIVTTNDPLEALFIAGKNMSGVGITNVHIRGLRGVRITDCDGLTLNNVQTDDGRVTIIADSRNLDKITLSNCAINSTTGFQFACFFSSTTGRSMSNVLLSNMVLQSALAGLSTSLAGGTMQMFLQGIHNVSGSNPTAETLAGIVRFSNLRGFIVPTLVSVNVPAVAAGAVGYVNTSMAGTRLADLIVGEGVVANPAAQLVAAGAGGAYVNCRVQAAGVVECAFLGPLAGGAANFNFNRAN